MQSSHEVSKTVVTDEQSSTTVTVGTYESPVIERLGNWQLVTLVGSIDIL